MKKVLVIVALIASLFITEKVQAQMYASYSPETFVLNSTGTDYTSTKYNGVSVGFLKSRRLQRVNYESDLLLSFGIQARLNTRSEEIKGTIKTNDMQILLDVPVLVKYRYHIEGSDIRVAGFAGPMVSVGIIGRTNTKTYVGDTQMTNTNSDWYGDNSNMNRFNLYLVLGGEARYRSFTVFAGYRVGLLDLDKRDDVRLRASGGFVGLALGI